MPDTIGESVAAIITEVLRGRRSGLTAGELRLLRQVASHSREATFVLGGIAAVLAASEAVTRPGPEVGPLFDDGPQPITPGPYPPDFPQPISPGPPDNPDGPQPITPGPPDNPSGPQPFHPAFPWLEQMVRYVLLPEFLVPAELQTITRFALENEDNFQTSQVVTPGETSGSVDFTSRRSRVLTDLGELGDMFRERVRRVLPLVGQRLGIDTTSIREIDVQLTASNDDEFFVPHIDSGAAFPRRAITYVYFFHREPAAFTGGELRLFHQSAVTEADRTPSRFSTVVPAQNQIVFFPSSLLHEVSRVSVPSHAFQDSRFTVNGWIHT